MGPPKTRWLHSTPAPNEEAAGFISGELASGLKSGYRITYDAGPVDSAVKIQTYAVHAHPIDSSVGDTNYFTDQTGVIRQQSGKEADANSPPIAGPEGVDCSGVGNFRLLARPFPVPPGGESGK
jgi:hypothetical protein